MMKVRKKVYLRPHQQVCQEQKICCCDLHNCELIAVGKITCGSSPEVSSDDAGPSLREKVLLKEPQKVMHKSKSAKTSPTGMSGTKNLLL